MQTKVSLSAYDHRVILVSLWSIPELSQQEREGNYDLAVSLGLGNEVYELALRGRLKEMVPTPSHLMVAPKAGEEAARVHEMSAHQEKIVSVVEKMHQNITVHELDTSHLKHLLAMFDKVKGPQVQDAFFLAAIGLKVRQVLAATSS